ncbi:Cobalamin import ATP-binding protein BtuD [uncultured archaeon]|nr:Cobalamin import ATP-binding protein BtuD [uncultured archaeon]
MKNPVVEVHEACFSYGPVSVLDKVNLVIEEGDFVGLVGPNGGGKTTLVKLILGLLTPKCGEIRLFGKPQRQFKEKHLIGYVPQTATSFDIHFPASVRDVVTMGRLSASSMGPSIAGEDRRIVDDALSKVGILDLADRRIGELSGGQKQRAFIARALAQKPRLLVLDEPTAGVDVESHERFYDLLHEFNKEGMTIIMVSHDIGVITQHANRIVCLAGNLFYHCPSKEFTEDRIKQIFGNQQILHHHHHNAEEKG